MEQERDADGPNHEAGPQRACEVEAELHDVGSVDEARGGKSASCATSASP
jgi:hypothetical protein